MEFFENTIKFFAEKDSSKRVTYFKTLLELSFVLLYSIYFYKVLVSNFQLIEPSDYKGLYTFFVSGRVYICLSIFVISFLISRYFIRWIINLVDFMLFWLLGSARWLFKTHPYKWMIEHKIIKERKRDAPQKGWLFEPLYHILKAFYLKETKETLKNLFYNVALIFQAFLIYVFYLKNVYHVPALINGLIWTAFYYIIFNQLCVYILVKALDKKGYSIIEKMEGFMRFEDNYDSVTTSFSSDKPIFSVRHNILPARDKYSRLLHTSIVNYNQKDSLVVCINGKWGDGKSSLINMALEPIIYNVTDKKYVFAFNPWNFTNTNGLISNFLHELKKFIRKILGHNYSANFENKISLYINYITKGDFNTPDDKLLQDNDTESLKNEIQRELRAADFKLIVVIDDIDRLDQDETLQVFKLIKSVADFPNLIYIIPFDKEQVIKKLNVDEEYLRKFIQVEIELPPLNIFDLKIILNDRVEKLTGLFKVSIDKNKWNKYVEGGVISYISNIRDINRFINGLKFNLSSHIVKEINITDFMVITAIQIFDHDLYSFIRNNKSLFNYSGGRSSFGNSSENEKKQLADQFKGFIKEKMYSDEFVNHFLCLLFPQLNSVIANYSYPYDSYRMWRKEALICSPFYFDKFFLVPCEEDKVSKQEFEAVLASSENLDDFKRNLQRIVSDDKFGFFIDRFPDYLLGKKTGNTLNIIKGFMSLKGPYSKNSHYDENQMFSLHNQMIYVVGTIIEDNDEFKAVKYLKQFFLNKKNRIESVNELYRRFCYNLKVEDGKLFNFDYLSSHEEFNNLKLQYLYRKRFRKSFKEMCWSKDCFWLLYSWKKLDPGNERFDWILKNHINKSPSHFVDFMGKLRQEDVVSSSKYGLRRRHVFKINYIQEIIDISFLQHKIKETEEYYNKKAREESVELPVLVKQSVFSVYKECFEGCVSGKIDYNDRDWYEKEANR